MPGRVVGSRLDSMGSGDSQIRCQIAFGYQGRDVVFWNRYTSSFAVDPVGREVAVLVNPADPHDAVVAGRLAGPRAVGVSFLAFGGIAVVLGLVLLTA